MKTFFNILVVFSCLAAMSYVSAAQPTNGAFKEISATARFFASEIQVIGVDVEGDKRLRFATWQEGEGEHTRVRMALMDTTGNLESAPVVFDREYAYGPRVRRVVNWQFGGHPVLAVVYQQGAAAAQIELFGVDSGPALASLDQRLGEEIEWRIGKDGGLLLSVYTKQKGSLVANCYRWHEKSHRLVNHSC